MLDVKQELAALKSEQQQILKNYQEAKEVTTNCERKLLQLQGAISFAEKQISEDKTKKKD
tara:strand:+ start:397 stop:576 length:180 start_codon:yes stop_codon:yes gene_type:complete